MFFRCKLLLFDENSLTAINSCDKMGEIIEKEISNSKANIYALIYGKVKNSKMSIKLIRTMDLKDDGVHTLRENNRMSKTTDMAKALISLYKKAVDSDGKCLYSCSTTKISKLLTLAEWIYAASNDGDDLFKEKIIKRKCGTSISGLAYEIGSRDFTEGENDNNQRMETEISNIVFPDSDLPESQKLLLKYIFIEFGAYKATALGEYINIYSSDVSENDEVITNDVLAKYGNVAYNSDFNLQKLDDYVEKYKTLWRKSEI